MSRSWLCISVYAGYWRNDGRRRRKDEPKPRAHSHGIGPKRTMQALAEARQTEAGGQAANVVYEALPYETALARYEVFA